MYYIIPNLLRVFRHLSLSAIVGGEHGRTIQGGENWDTSNAYLMHFSAVPRLLAKRQRQPKTMIC
jgi:hypothetical protein